MTDAVQKLARRYTQALRQYLAHGREAFLQRAYDLGREAITHDLGVLNIGKIHQEALCRLLRASPGPHQAFPFQAAETFFMEALSPFEATQRGFRETNRKLSELNETLARRNLDLAAAIRELKREIHERIRAEKALRESKEHYKVLFKEACEMQENLRHLSNQVLHAQEQERKRISRELHDEVGQALTAVNVHLAMLRNAASLESPDSRRKISDAQQLLEQSMDTVHHFARELRPAMLDDLGLAPALRCYTKSFSERTGVRVRFNACPGAEQLGSEQKLVLFRVAQESLTNVAKHAHAREVRLEIRQTPDAISMEVADDGRAFRVDEQIARNGKKRLGLLGMQERVRLIHGQFAIESHPGKGTTIRVRIPFTAQRLPAAARPNHDAPQFSP